MPIERRSAQSKSGISIRTRKGTPIFPENSPQNTTAFGVDNAAAPAGANFLAAAGAGFCWVVTSLIVSWNVAPGNTVRVTFTGGLAAVATVPAGATVPAPAAAQVITSPTAMPVNSVFGYGSSGTGNFSISGTAYKATVASITNPQAAQVIATTIDSDPAADLG